MSHQEDRAKIDILGTMLEMTVPFEIADLAARGGPTDSDLERLKPLADKLVSHGDAFMYPSDSSKAEKRELAGTTGEIIGAVAVLAFQPGGVKPFGVHFDTGMPDITGKRTAVTSNIFPGTIPLLDKIAEERIAAMAAAKPPITIWIARAPRKRKRRM